jgi:RNA-binding protein
MPAPINPKKRSLMRSTPLRRTLRAAGHHLSPVVQIGKEGITDPVLRQLDDALETHELVKVKLGAESPEGRFEAAERIAAERGVHLAQVLGRTLLVYRRHPSRPRFEPLAPAEAAAAKASAAKASERKGGARKGRARKGRVMKAGARMGGVAKRGAAKAGAWKDGGPQRGGSKVSAWKGGAANRGGSKVSAGKGGGAKGAARPERRRPGKRPAPRRPARR